MVEPTVRTTALKAWMAVPTADRSMFADGPSSMMDDDMPLCQFVRMAESMADRSGDPLLGWSVGLGFDLASLGDMGEAIMASRCLHGALQRVVDYFSIIQDAADVRLEVMSNDAVISYRILDPGIWPRRQDALFTLGIFAKIIRSAIGSAWAHAEVALESDGAGARKEAQKVLGAPCAFNSETNLIRFPAHLLENSLGALARPKALNHARLSHQVAQRRRRMPTALRVRHLIFQDLNDGGFSQEQVARSLGMSSRTLRRRLADEGVSFQSLLDECRMRLAAFEFRTRPDASIAQTALRLGYSEHSTFTRAFLRWNGMPPQSYLRCARSRPT